MELPNPIRSTRAAFIAGNPVLKRGQNAIETDTKWNKVGDGVTAYNALGYSEYPQQYNTASGTDTYTGDLLIVNIPGYYVGLKITVKFTNANTGASTFNLNSLGAKDIKNAAGGALSANDIRAGAYYDLIYNGTYFQLK